MTKCRFCKNKTKKIYNFGNLPIANNLVKFKKKKTEKFELKLVVCRSCFLVQTSRNLPKKKIFSDSYPYLSSSSKTLLNQSQILANKVIKRFNLNSRSFVTEIASNDGYLLQYFKKKKISCLGVEPTKIPFLKSKKKGITSLNSFFNYELSKKITNKFGKSDLVIANNVIAHIPNLNNFIKGLINLLKTNGILIVEFQYLNEMIKKKLFDNVYHEHYYYYSLNTFNKIIKKFDCIILNYDKIPAHGGSLRVYITDKNTKRRISKKVNSLLLYENKIGVEKLNYYLSLSKIINKKIGQTKEFLFGLNNKNKKIVGFGAAAKTASILNFCKINNNIIRYIFDNASSKINKIIPGTGIKILKPKKILFKDVDIIIIFVWNLQKEIFNQIKKLYDINRAKIYILSPKIKKIYDK